MSLRMAHPKESANGRMSSKERERRDLFEREKRAELQQRQAARFAGWIIGPITRLDCFMFGGLSTIALG